MGTKVGEFFIDMVVDAASGELSVRKLVGALGDLEVAALGETWGAAKIAQKFADMAENAMTAAHAFTMFTATTDISWQKLQQWQIALRNVTKPEEVTAAFNSVLKAGADMELFGKVNMPMLNLHGFNAIDPEKSKASGRLVMKDFEGIMNEFLKNTDFWSKGAGVQQQMLAAFNLGPDMLASLKEMRKPGWNAHFKEAAGLGITEAQRAGMEELRRKLIDAGRLAMKVGTNMLIGFGLAGKVVDEISKGLKAIEKFQEGKKNLGTLGKMISSFEPEGIEYTQYDVGGQLSALHMVLDKFITFMDKPQITESRVIVSVDRNGLVSARTEGTRLVSGAGVTRTQNGNGNSGALDQGAPPPGARSVP